MSREKRRIPMTDKRKVTCKPDDAGLVFESLLDDSSNDVMSVSRKGNWVGTFDLSEFQVNEDTCFTKSELIAIAARMS